MRKNLYFIIILCTLTSCYTYQVKKPVDPAVNNNQGTKKNTAIANNPSTEITGTNPASQSLSAQPAPVNIQEKLAAGKNVKIEVDNNSYKVIVDRWEGDSLVAHPVRNAKKSLKFHKNQINSERIAEKRFSQPIADILTVTAYAAIGVGIYLLVK
ncbi:CCR4-NOT transcriptional regulation complex NOT5 subunit [Chryseobacterium bernardetii]|jgi:CCR4-NOT transcriptional regulation complex NOT5 subunit|uniref:Lipoprotein n=3 Tax=Chryseobacterium TaxID=59732 RepID=A0A543ELB5_9FLAO|nr:MULTISPECIES: hypothetical protein [Chryseobacterium]MDR6368748.1 CCR4-NOT transcriptional regulation complex NOT5 subunit [Chryseobacterium vietnamense]MDR6440329.1 CCR4-NOT transcriptional regulation complex NOT5 subunit [Chryseobacterium bernardetii]MDR6458782.1 CCR4-NOT transcriptional regulation complex NOT5 subunit [Chryseobacterium vietnamense]TQM22360.1 hypothetical protein FB551_2072 [Chryseobacterium aquifrigidense]